MKNLQELDLEQLQNTYNTLNATRFMLNENGLDSTDVRNMMEAVDIEASKRFGDYWNS